MTMTLQEIGRIYTPFRTLAACPRNGRQIQPAPDCTVLVDPAWLGALAGLEGISHLVLLYWLGPQAATTTVTPLFDGQQRGVFATRSPARPNPIGLSIVELVSVEGGTLTVRNLDCLDGTPLLDIKPYLPSTDSEPDATMGWLAPHRTPRVTGVKGVTGVTGVPA